MFSHLTIIKDFNSLCVNYGWGSERSQGLGEKSSKNEALRTNLTTPSFIMSFMRFHDERFEACSGESQLPPYIEPFFFLSFSISKLPPFSPSSIAEYSMVEITVRLILPFCWCPLSATLLVISEFGYPPSLPPPTPLPTFGSLFLFLFIACNRKKRAIARDVHVWKTVVTERKPWKKSWEQKKKRKKKKRLSSYERASYNFFIFDFYTSTLSYYVFALSYRSFHTFRV